MSRGVTCDGTDTASRGKMECRLRLSDWCSRGPDVILVTGTPAALAAKNATATIPIVFFHVADPVGAGLVGRRNRDGIPGHRQSRAPGHRADRRFDILGRTGTYARLALQNRLPTMSQSPDQVQAGGLMSYGASEAEFLRIAGRLVARILRGTKPGDLPVEQPTKLDLVINLKTAKPWASRSRRRCSRGQIR
jgi:hypothetical protein